jgi:mono/diheme cytochrome c family protein
MMAGSFRVRVGALIIVMLAAALAPTAARADDIELPDGPNRALVYGQCRTCHDLQYLRDSAGIPADAWAEILESMGQYGWRPAPDVRDKLLVYLSTYLGPHPPPAGAAKPDATAKAGGQAAAADGEALFKDQCVACHQETGKGVPDQFPPLAGNHDLFLGTFPALVLLYGMEGKIEVVGKAFDAAMPPFGHLSDAEIAALVRYVRAAWGNDKLRPAAMAPIDASAVEALRKPELTPQQVWARRAQ